MYPMKRIQIQEINQRIREINKRGSIDLGMVDSVNPERKAVEKGKEEPVLEL